MNPFADFQLAAHTIPNQDRDFVTWHRGKKAYYFWALMIADVAWCHAARAAMRWLEPFLVPGYRRQPHVTLLPAGFSSLTATQRDQATSIALETKSFQIGLGELSSFTASPCFEIKNEGRNLERLKNDLTLILGDVDSAMLSTPYIPHLTVGLYRDRFDTTLVSKRLHAFSKQKVPDLVVDHFSFCRYETSSIKGIIEVVDEFTLTTA